LRKKHGSNAGFPKRRQRPEFPIKTFQKALEMPRK
jgi:hypothetical protein